MQPTIHHTDGSATILMFQLDDETTIAIDAEPYTGAGALITRNEIIDFSVQQLQQIAQVTLSPETLRAALTGS